MSLPTKEDISVAIESSGAIKASELEGYSPVPGIIGPESYSGGFCIVFPFVKGRDKKAVRIWHQEIDNIQERYKLLSKDTKHCHVKSIIGIEYVEGGMTVDGTDIDLTLMDWIEGKPLKDYISSILSSNKSEQDQKKAIRALADDLEEIFKKMHVRKFSHGDLQHDNIIITNNGSPRFIDYDSFYTPSMGMSFYQTTSGYNGYQHPSRFSRQYLSNEKADFFSELILALSLRAISNDFTLWDITEDLDYSLILTPEDFYDLQASKTCQRIRAIGDVKCNQLLDILADYLKKDSIDDLESFDVLLDRLNITFECTKNLIKKGTSSEIRWKIGDCKEVTVTSGDQVLSTSKKKGAITVSPSETTDYELHLTYDSGAETSRTLTIEVYPEAKGVFTCDKQYVFPGVPFVLEWAVENAVKVELNGQSVQHKDKKYYTKGVDNETEYVLSITDHFGTRSLKIVVKMLPMPMVKEILIPKPNINVTLNIQSSFPSFLDTKITTVDINNENGKSLFVEEPEKKGILVGLPTFTKSISKVSKGVRKLFGKKQNN